MTKQHARLSPSAAERWIHCPGSVQLAEQCPPPESSAYADEGTAAHALAELKLRAELGEITTRKYAAELKKQRAGEYYCGEMDEATDFYKDIVQEKLAGAGKDAVLMAEQRFDLSDVVPGCFGTSDAVIIGGDTIEVIDLKYGKGIRVDAKDNPQTRLYGLGAATLFSGLYDIETVRMTIVQPRLDHVSTEELPFQALREWAETVVRPAAAEAVGEDPHEDAGDWCRWCPAKAICRTRAQQNLELARYDFQEPALLTPDEIGEILGRIDELTRWAADVQEYALNSALNGERFEGWKLVEGRSVRKYADDLKVAAALQAAGFPEAALYERKLLGISAMEKVVGKKKLTETLGDLIIKPAGKPVLVPITDKREAINTTDAERRIVVDSAAAEAVREVYRMQLAGATLQEMREALFRRGITHDGKMYGKGTLYRMLRNDHYLGQFSVQGVDIDVEPIIDRATFEAVQSSFKGRVHNAAGRAKVEYLLSCKCYCEICGKMLHGTSGKSKRGTRYYYYKCPTPGCDLKSIRKEELEELVLQHTIEDVLTDEMIEKVTKRVMEVQEEERAADPSEALRGQLEAAEKKQRNLVAAIENGAGKAIVERLVEVEQQIAVLEAEIERAELRMPMVPEGLIRSWLESFRDGDVTDLNFRRRLLQTFVYDVVVGSDQVTVRYNTNQIRPHACLRTARHPRLPSPYTNSPEVFGRYIVVRFLRQ